MNFTRSATRAAHAAASNADRSGPEPMKIDAIAQHMDVLFRHAQRLESILEGLGYGDNACRVAGGPYDHAARQRVLGDEIDVRAARGDHNRLIEPPSEQDGRNAVWI